MELIARRARRNIKSQFLHIIVQGIEKQYIFQKEIFKQKYLSLIQENLQEFNIKLIAYTNMDNHVHLCIYYENIEAVSKFMHKINSHFATYYNLLENRVGYLFRNTFYTQEIFDKQQLFNVIAYIHNNPLKAKMIKYLGEYKYSSYNQYKNKEIDKNIILLVFETCDYMPIFDFIHKNYNELTVLDIKEEQHGDYERLIRDFCIENNIPDKTLRYDEDLLMKLIKKMKSECYLTNKKISELLKINKNRIGKIVKKIKEK